ncbi:MAG: hypothetical protein AB2L12_01695 [Smithellaceae bacterium]
MKAQTRKLVLYRALLVLILVLSGYLPEYIKVANAADPAAKYSATCLACHGGSFDKLASKKPTFKVSDDRVVNPHKYIPHNEKKAENVPNCTDCHVKHSIAPMEKVDLSKVKVDSCFLSCHHTQNFERCSTCHTH